MECGNQVEVPLHNDCHGSSGQLENVVRFQSQVLSKDGGRYFQMGAPGRLKGDVLLKHSEREENQD